MSDPRFYTRQGPYTLAELADAGGATVGEGTDPERTIHDVAPLNAAGVHDISFLHNSRYLAAFSRSRAGACVVRADDRGSAPAEMGLLIADSPHMAFARIARTFYPVPEVPDERSADATIDTTAQFGPHCNIGPGAVIGPRVEIGARCSIGANAVIGAGVVLGDDVWVGACVSLAYCIIGSRVRILSGARIGEDGFGFAPDSDTPVNVPQLGRVMIEDDVEIGANSTIDRGAGPDTVIGRGCRIDNLVQIGHNVELGRGCIVIAQAGIAGSTRLDDGSIVAAQGGVAGHLRIGKDSRIAAKAGVMRDVPDGVSVGGIPAVPMKQWFRQVATVQRLAHKKGQ